MYDSSSYDDGFGLVLSDFDTSDDDSLADDLFDDEILKENWFHGLKPRRQIKKLLQEDGDFLVSASKDKSTKETVFTLSVFWNKLRDFKIRHDEVRFKTIFHLSMFYLNLSKLFCVITNQKVTF